MLLTKETFVILSQRGWQSLSGVITLVVILNFLTQEQQGWYYAFVSVAALYSVFEMGLASAILQIASHMFSGLSWGKNGQIKGAGFAAFESFSASALKIYTQLALLFFLVAMPTGMYIFSARNVSGLSGSWYLPWMFLLSATALNMLFFPFLAIAEGSGEINEVYSIRLLQGILGAVACWLALFCGENLWAAAMGPFAGVVVGSMWLILRKRAWLLKTLDNHNEKFGWRTQVWSFQWRVGVSWISVFLTSQLATPILFYYQDAVTAGQMGLSLTIAHMLGIFSQSWIARDVPAMSVAASHGNWGRLDRIFFADFKHMTLVFLLGSVFLVLIYGMLSDTPYVKRVLPFWQVIGLLAFVLLFQIAVALAAYLRSFRKEPLMLIYSVGAILIVIGSLFAAGQYSSSGVVLVMLAVQGFWVFPLSVLVWKTCRQSWSGVAIDTTP